MKSYQRTPKNRTPISIKLGDSFYFHYVYFKNIYSYPEQKQDRVRDEHRFMETFGFVDSNGDVSRYSIGGEWQHQDWLAPKGQATKQTMKRVSTWLNDPGYNRFNSATYSHEVLHDTEIYWMN